MTNQPTGVPSDEELERIYHGCDTPIEFAKKVRDLAYQKGKEDGRREAFREQGS